MKRKFKDFLNKRVISVTLSAAMAFNMAAYLPISAFAHDDTSAESTVDLNEIKVSGQLMSNGYLAMNVLGNGHFSFGTTGGNPDNPKDDNKRLLYGFSGNSTSYTTIRINDSSYVYSPTQNEFNADDKNNTSNAVYSDVDVQQVLSIVKNPATGNDDLIEVKYIVTNNSDVEKNVGLRIMMDTMLGGNDHAPFRVPQYGSITTETEYTGDDIPQFWQAFDNLTSPTVIAQGRLFQTEEDRPDKVQFCNWGSINGVNWDYHTTAGRGNGDSAVAMTWNEAALAPNETREYVTGYGLSELTEDLTLPLGLSVYSDSELSVVNNQYAPNPVDVTAYVQNLSTNTAEDVHVSIELPDNLTLTNNSEQTIDIGPMTPNQLEQASWSVYVSPSAQDMTYQYTVVLTAADGYEKRVSRSIHVPALQAEVLSPYVLFSGSDSTDFTLNCWKSTFNGDVYTGKNFISNASELYLNGNVNAVDSIFAYGWKVNIEERNEHIEKEEMPDWDSRIIATAGDYETSDEDVVKIEDKNVIDGALKTTGNVIISSTTFDGNCYIIADGNITYNVNDFKSFGRIVLYSRNGNITINGTNIDVNGIMYAPNGKVVFNSNVANINGRIFADKINFSGSVFNVNGSDSDWELLGRKAVIAKTYTFDEDFNEGEYDGLGLDIADELTLVQRTDSVSSSSENEYKDNDSINGIALNVKTDKSVLTNDGKTVNVEFDLNGFGSQEVEENNVDLAIVVDTSGSMSGTRRNNAVSAAKEVVSKMKLGDRCAIIKFTTSATVLQSFTDDAELLNTAIDKLNANGGTNIATGINSAVELFDETGSASRQKYIILMSDGQDSSSSAQAATDAFGKRITICALAIGGNSIQMETIANNTKGYYKNSPTADQIGEMMNMFADVVFNNAGTDVSLTATLNRNASADIDNMTPAPAEIIENENGTKTLKWTFDKLTIDQSEKINLPISVNGIRSGLNNVISDVSCTYYNRAGVSNTVYADDVILPSHTYKQEGSWTTVYDSKTAGTEWKNIYWNGKLYDDSVLSVMAQTGDDLDAFGEWTEITNHKDITNLKGRYIRVKVNMAVSSSGKTPELYDITLLSDGVDKVNYLNNAPIISVSGNTTTSVSKKITLISTAEDDAFNSKLSFNWNCDSENVQIFGSNKPYASFKFNESGTYDITLSVSDDSSTSVITKTITVLNDDVLVKPMIDIDVPSVVKSGATLSGSIINLNDAEIAEYEVLVGGNTVNVSSNGQFSFTAPDSDTIIAVEAKALNIVGVSGSADKSIIVDATAPTAQLKADKNEVNVNEAVTITAFVDDENGISDYSLTLGGEAVSLDSNYQFSFVPTAIGTYAFELNVTDMAGHSSSASLTINVAEGKAQPVVNYSIPRVIMLGETGDFAFVSDSDAVVTVKVNGEAVQLDADGKFSYTPDTVGNLTIDIHATNGGNTDTDFTLTVPVVKVELISDKTSYTDEELITIKLVYSDNLTITSQTATIDNILYTISDDTIQADRLDAGSHEVVWYAEDENGNIYTGTMVLAVQDMTPPEIEVVLSENALKPGDSVDANIFATDRYGIDSVSATFDATSIAVSGNKVVLTNLTAGTHVLAVTATDNNGISSIYNYEFNVSAGDTTPPELEVSVSVGENRRIEITASATDDSGKVEITGTINGKKLTFNDGKAYYDPDDYGKFEIVIRAEDAAGNYTEKTQTVTISEQIKEYELKLSVGLDKNPIKPNETANITVRTNTLLEDVTISCTNDGGNLTQTENGYAFVSDKEGTFKIVVTASDESGNSVSETVYITVSKEQQVVDDDHEGEGEYENTYTPEPRARVILDSNEKTETKMTEEMADLADHLKTPLAVYEYLYNNVNVEFYIGSRKGAVGTYEQNGGNDVDCASLLIAMLRYLGYDAEYVTGKIGITEKQLLELTGTDSIDDALNIIGIHFKPISKSANYYYFTHTWVRTVINGESHDIDISFKKYKRVLSLNDAAEYANKNYSTDEMLGFTDIRTYQNFFNDEMIANPDAEFSFSGRAIVQKAIKELPSRPNYIQTNEPEIVSNICDSKVILRDKVTFTISGESKEYYSPYLYTNDLTIGYTFNPDDLELMEMLEFPYPNSVYGLINAYYITGVRLDASPAIYINNKINYTWNEATSVIDSNDLKITVFSSGITLDYEKTIDCGSINAFQFDFQNISPQEIMTSYANMPSEDVIGNIDTTKFRDSDCLKNYLTLMGAMYFSEFDIQNKLISSSLDVRQEKLLSFGVFSYKADIKAAKESDYGATFDKTGSLEVDILDNTYIQKSYTGNAEDEQSFHFLSGLASSYLESEIVEQFTGESAVSTVSVLETAMDMDVPIICINSKNIDKLNTLGLYDEDKAIIREAVESGAYVTVPERNIKIDSWTGTGYIIQNEATGDLTFKISGALNGGATPNKATQDALKKFALICGTVAFVDTVSALYSSVMMMSNAVMSLMFASSTLGVVGSVAIIGASIALMNAALKSYQAAIRNCFLVLEGNPEAAMELLIDTELTLIVNVLGELGVITASAIKNRIAKNYIKSSLPEELVPEIYKAFEGSEESVAKFMKTAKNAGIDTDCLTKLLRDSGCIDKYPKKVLKQLGKLEKEAQWAIIDGIEKCSKDFPDILKKLDKESLGEFFKAVSKDTDEVFEQLAKISDTEKAVDFIVKYGDSASNAIAKHGDRAVTLLDMFPSKECADILSNSSENLVDSISKLDKTAAEKFINVVAKNDKALIDSINNCSFVDDAVKMISKFEDNGVDIFIKYKDKEVIGLSKSLDSSSSNAITFTECKNGKVYVAGSCNYKYNPTITVPDGYIKQSQPSSYYFERYNHLLTDDGIKEMNVPDEVAVELKKLNDAIEKTREKANELQLYTYQCKGCESEYTLAFGHSITNCGEIWSVREAILNGAKFDDINLSTFWNGDKSRPLGEFMEKCDNCQVTFS